MFCQVVHIESGHVAFEFDSQADFIEAFPNGINESGFELVEREDLLEDYEHFDYCDDYEPDHGELVEWMDFDPDC